MKQNTESDHKKLIENHCFLFKLAGNGEIFPL